MGDTYKIGMLRLADLIQSTARIYYTKKKEELGGDDSQLETLINADYAERKDQIDKWAEIAVDVIDQELIETYKKVLTDYVFYGPGNGSSMDLTMNILNELKVSDNMDYAVEMLNSTQDEDTKFFIQNMVFEFSNKGPNFVTKTLGRPLSAEEIVSFDIKRKEVSKREQGTEAVA